MDRGQFCRQSRLLVVAGKGGVGKTTVTAALARVAADAGLDVLVVGLDDAGALPALFGADEGFGYDEVLLYESGSGRVRGRVITPDDALLEYLMDHGLKRVAKRLVSLGVLDVVSTAIPGIREILVLGKVKQLERGDTPDLLILDAPATGHAVRFLTSANGLLDAARGGPLRTQAAEVVEMLHDPERCQVLLVTLAEETPVNELIETAFRLEDEVGIMLGPVVVNAVYPALTAVAAAAASVAGPATGSGEVDERPGAAGEGSATSEGAGAAAGVAVAAVVSPAALAEIAGESLGAGEAERLAAAAEFRFSREAVQAEQLNRLGSEMPLPRLTLPYLFSSDIGPDDVAVLAEALGRGIDDLGGAP